MKQRIERRARIKKHIVKKVRGTSDRPRLTVYHSLKHLYAQIVDDSQSKTLVSSSTLSKGLRDAAKDIKSQKELAKQVGLDVAKKAIEQKITTVVFDRNGYMYHGIVKALAEAAREGGLRF